MAPFGRHLGLSFGSCFETFSRTGRFSKIRTAPTRELCFRGSSLSKSIHVGLYFRFRLRLRVRCYPEPPVGAIYVDSVPKIRNFSPPLGHWVAKWFPKGHPRVQKGKKRVPTGDQERVAIPTLFRARSRPPFWHGFCLRFGILVASLRARFGAVWTARRVSQGARTSTDVPIVLGPPCNNSARKAHCNTAT